MHPKLPKSNKEVRIWSMDTMRDTVADPKLIVINKPSYGQEVQRKSTDSSSNQTANFGKSASEI